VLLLLFSYEYQPSHSLWWLKVSLRDSYEMLPFFIRQKIIYVNHQRRRRDHVDLVRRMLANKVGARCQRRLTLTGAAAAAEESGSGAEEEQEPTHCANSSTEMNGEEALRERPTLSQPNPQSELFYRPSNRSYAELHGPACPPPAYHVSGAIIASIYRWE